MAHALACQRAGRTFEAVQAYRAALAARPDDPRIHNNLGVALKALGDEASAAEHYRRALELAPGYANAHRNLGVLRRAQGRYDESLRSFLAALRLDPDSEAHRRSVARVAPHVRFREASPWVAEALALCLQDDGIDHQRLAPAVVSLLQASPAFRAAMAADDPGLRVDTDGPSVAARFQPVTEHPLFLSLLERVVIPDPDIEGLLTALRRHWLSRSRSDNELGSTDLSFACALACQCFLTDYAYVETETETRLLQDHCERAPDRAIEQRRLTPELVVLAMYRPLHGLDRALELSTIEGPFPPALERLRRRQLLEPMDEARRRTAIPRLTGIAGAVSHSVQAQYEANPYPRWTSRDARDARPLNAVVRDLFPDAASTLEQNDHPKILVAGCGTGKHAIDVATRYADATVLAVDLSLASLAFAQRRADAQVVPNLRFGQADIMALGAWDKRFALIEAVGVLHHLERPVEGWQILVDLLADKGLMRIGLYSTHARTHIRQARSYLDAQGFTPDPNGLRAARRALMALDQGAPERKVLEELDFYSLSGCRDLLFNVQETSFDLPAIADALAQLGLRFLGFEFPTPDTEAAYAAFAPGDTSMTDLASWDRFEQAHPDTFRQMYQFWCQKR